MTTEFDRDRRGASQTPAVECSGSDIDNRGVLSAKIERISYELDKISELIGVASDERALTCSDNVGSVPKDNQSLAAQVLLAIRSRRERAKHLPAQIFSDPAWDILLDLFHSELLQQRTAINDLCIASQVPPSTALRWIGTLTDLGIIARRPDPLDGRRVYVELTSRGQQSLRAYFESVLRQSSLKAY